MICEICQAQGLTSTIHPDYGCSRTLMYCYPYYDAFGNYHSHDSNIVTRTGSCSNGHSYRELTIDCCPSYPNGCGWKGETKLEWYED